MITDRQARLDGKTPTVFQRCGRLADQVLVLELGSQGRLGAVTTASARGEKAVLAAAANVRFLHSTPLCEAYLGARA